MRLHRTFYPGERSVNATQVNGVDALDPAAIGKADAELRRQIGMCVAFLRKHVLLSGYVGDTGFEVADKRTGRTWRLVWATPKGH